MLSQKEAKQYLENQTLYERLKEITSAVLSHRGGDIVRIMGSHIIANMNKGLYAINMHANPFLVGLFAQIVLVAN